MSSKIGSVIASKRDSKGLTREQLAKKAKISTGYLFHVEANHVPLTDDVAGRISKALGTKFKSADLARHNVKAKVWLSEYRSGLKSKKSSPKTKAPAMAAPRKVKPKQETSKDQYQLPGIAEMIGAELRLQVQDMVRAALQRGLNVQAVESDEVEVTPIFKKA